MGWNCDDGTHEGYLVGLVFDDSGSFQGHAHPTTAERKTGPTSGRMRELGLPCDDHRGVTVECDTPLEVAFCLGPDVALSYVKVACSCGWRSPLVSTWPGTRWVPSVVLAPAAFEDLARQVWEGHVHASGAARDGGYSVEVLAAHADHAAVSRG